MSWDIDITPPEGFPDVQEPVCSFGNCPGNMYTAVIDLTGKHLRHMDTHDEAISALKDVIAEIGKNDKGMFNNAYCVCR